MKTHVFSTLAGAVLLCALFVSVHAAGADLMVVRVYYEETDDIRLLSDFDLWEFREPVLKYVLANVDADGLERLRSLGFRAVVDEARTQELHPPRPPTAVSGIPGFPCYRTVEETYQTALQIVADHPTLATWTDVGNSWEKASGLGGYDLNVLRLTNSAVAGVKPKLIMTCSIHAREYTPAELCARFAELLVAGHGVDPDATWILDHQEVHLMLMANPDGRKKAETGLFWRKNTNQNYCGSTSQNRGADLNRNFVFEWGCCGGSSSSECSETYRGPSPASEPEVQAVQAYLRAQLPDQRGPNLTDPAPPGTANLYLDIHSAAELVLWPWGFDAVAPNATALTTLGRKLAYFNDYVPQQAIDLYATDGTTIDFGYGDLGVASYVFELGTTFFQSCSTFESTILPDNLASLLYAARVARAPYLTPAGPDSLNVAVFPGFVDAGDLVTVSASANDTRYNTSNGTEPTQNISAAELYLKRPWGIGAGQPQPMSATDGAFSAKVEGVTVTIDTAGLAGGRHLIFVRSRDNAGNWGAFSAGFLWIRGGPEGNVQGAVTELGSGQGIEATLSVDSLGTDVVSSAVDGSYSLPLPPGTWTVRASSPYHVDQTVASIVVTDQGSVVQDFALELIDGDDDGVADALDCAAGDPQLWSAPGPVTSLRLAKTPADNLLWDPPPQPGGVSGLCYDVLRAASPSNFNLATCLESDEIGTSATEIQVPAVGTVYHYLIRVANACGSTLGADSAGSERQGVACP